MPTVLSRGVQRPKGARLSAGLCIWWRVNRGVHVDAALVSEKLKQQLSKLLLIFFGHLVSAWIVRWLNNVGLGK